MKVFLPTTNSKPEVDFLADKVYVHRRPMDSPHWSTSFTEEIDCLNKNKAQKNIHITETSVQIEDFNFTKIKKIGVTIPLFKKETLLEYFHFITLFFI